MSIPKPLRTLWLDETNRLCVIDQTLLPHQVQVQYLQTLEEVHLAIKNMLVRGAPLIGATAAFGVWLACKQAPQNQYQTFIQNAIDYLASARPTAVNLFWALERMKQALEQAPDLLSKTQIALTTAQNIVEEDIDICYQIGQQGLKLLQELAQTKPNQTLNILTHCNAGMMGCIRWGTVTSPIYQAHALGLNLHVWVDETRPRNQGAITAWELGQHQVPHTLITDNEGGLLMQQGLVDLVLVGTDRVSTQGDVANKIGTYLKALAAKDNQIPFYVALPSTTIDWKMNNMFEEIHIETRSPEEVLSLSGLDQEGQIRQIRLFPPQTPALNHGFDLTPARLVSGFITERGICPASEQGLRSLFPDKH